MLANISVKSNSVGVLAHIIGNLKKFHKGLHTEIKQFNNKYPYFMK